MSSLKRSLSSSNIPRLSRLPVRQSNASRAPRSSSVRSSYANTNLLTVYGSGTMGRSSSYSNLVTPSQRIQCVTPSTSSVSKDSKIHDKDWQKSQLHRVKMFFHESNPNMSLKPLTIRTYVYTMDILFKQLDNRISITNENYKDSVPDNLKSFKYPYSLKPSVIKSPAVPTSWQYVLQIWIWLIDSIDIVQNPERILSQVIDDESQKFPNNSEHYMAQRFMAFNQEGETQDDVDERFLINLAQSININMDNTKQLDEECRNLDKHLESLEEADSSMQLSIKAISDKVSALRTVNTTTIQKVYDHRNNILDQIRVLTIKAKNLNDNLAENEEKVENLKRIISEQPHTKEDMIQLDKKIEEECNLQKYNNESRKDLAHLVEEYDTKLTSQKQAFNTEVYKINNKIAPLIYKVPELRDLKIPEKVLSEPDLDCYIKNFNEKIKHQSTFMNMESRALETKYEMLEQENKKDIAKLESAGIKLKEIIETENKHKYCFEKNREDHQKQIDKKRLNITEVEQKRKNLLASKPNIDSLERKLKSNIEKENELTSLSDEILTKGESLILTVHNNIKETMDTEKTIMFNIQESLENSFNVDLTALDEIIHTLKEQGD